VGWPPRIAEPYIRDAVICGQTLNEFEQRGKHVHVFVGIQELEIQPVFETTLDLGPPFVCHILGTNPARQKPSDEPALAGERLGVRRKKMLHPTA